MFSMKIFLFLEEISLFYEYLPTSDILLWVVGVAPKCLSHNVLTIMPAVVVQQAYKLID